MEDCCNLGILSEIYDLMNYLYIFRMKLRCLSIGIVNILETQKNIFYAG